MIIIIDIRYNAGIGTYIFYTIRNNLTKNPTVFRNTIEKIFLYLPI